MKRLVLVPKGYLRIVFLFACTLLSYPVFSQENKTVPAAQIIDSLQTILKTEKDDSSKVNNLNILSNRHRMLANYDSALLYAESAQYLAEKTGFKKGIADAFRNIGIIYFRQSNYPKALECQYKSFAIYQDIVNKQGIASTLDNIGLVYYTLGNYSKALECYFKVLPIAQEIKDKNTIANVFCNMGIIYGEQGNYPKAVEYIFKSLEMHIEIGDKDNIAINLEDIGYSYLIQKDYTKALEYNFKAIAQAEEVGDKTIVGMGFDNVGNTYYEQANYIRALEYDFKAVAIVRKIGDIDEVANLYSNIGRGYTKLQDYKRAKIFLDSALNFSISTGNKKYIENTYENLTALDKALGNYKTAYIDYEKYIAYRDSIINQGTGQMEISYEFEKREDSIRSEYEKENIIKTAEIKRKKILNVGAMIIVIFTILLAILLINRLQIKRKRDKIISEKEKAMLTIEKQHMEEELLNAKKALEDHTKSMAEKSELLEQFKTDIEKLKNLKSKELEDVRVEQLEHLNKTIILTEADWNKFKELFEQVYKGFLIRLKEKLPDLSQAEIRLVCLIKLKLDNKQMANILGVSFGAIRMTRLRLRKKLGLSENKSIDDIAESI